MKMTFLQGAVILSTAVLITACSSVNNDDLIGNNIQTNSAVYSCNESPLNALFHAEQAQVTWKGEEYLLHHSTSASGSFYLEKGVSFWVHEKKAELTLEDMEAIQCRLVRIDS